MNEADILKLASQGGAIAISALCLFRLGRMEKRIEAIAAHLGGIDCPKHKRALGAPGMLAIFVLTAILSVAAAQALRPNAATTKESPPCSP